MGYKYLGNMGVQVSQLHFGTMSFDDTGMREEIAALPPTPPPATQRSETQTSAK
jgi:aryl-alcohol dehydrogenase-like predicted oxidoreductase